MLRYIESWLAEGRVDATAFFLAARHLVGPESVLHLEGGSIAGTVKSLAEAHPAPFAVDSPPSSGWLTPTVLTCAATPEVLTRFAELSKSLAEPEIGETLRILDTTGDLLFFHDCFFEDAHLLVTSRLDPALVRRFFHDLGVSFHDHHRCFLDFCGRHGAAPELVEAVLGDHRSLSLSDRDLTAEILGRQIEPTVFPCGQCL